jgi:hypothetical protein
MFSSSHMLNVHGHGWSGWHDACGALGRVQTVCVSCLTEALRGRSEGPQVGVWEAGMGDCLRSAHIF